MASSESKQRAFKKAVQTGSALDQQVQAFVEDVDSVSFAFPAELTGAERAAVHKIARRCGLKAKSDGSEDDGTRRITLYRPSSEEERLRAVAVAEQKHAQAEEQRAAKKQKQQEKYPDEPDEAEASAAAAAATVGEDGERNPELDTQYDSQEEQAVDDMDGSDLHKLMGVPKKADDGGVMGGPSRLRAAYHRQLLKSHPDTLKWTPSSGCPRVQAYRASKRKFRQVCIAYAIMMDEDRRRIYSDHGIEGLKKAEAYQESNIFELDPWEACEKFFGAEDPDDREYFLLNGNEQLSDEDSAEEDEQDEEEETAEEIAAAAAAAAEALKDPSAKKKRKGDVGAEGKFPRPPTGLGAAAMSPAAMSVPHDPWLSLNKKIAQQTEEASSPTLSTKFESPGTKLLPKGGKLAASPTLSTKFESPGTKLLPKGGKLAARLAEFEAFKKVADGDDDDESESDSDSESDDEEEEEDAEEDADDDGEKDYTSKHGFSTVDSPGTKFVGLETVSLADLQAMRAGPSVANADSDEEGGDDNEDEDSEEDDDDDEDAEESQESEEEYSPFGPADQRDSAKRLKQAKAAAAAVMARGGDLAQAAEAAQAFGTVDSSDDDQTDEDEDDDEYDEEGEKAFSAAMFKRLKGEGLIEDDEDEDDEYDDGNEYEIDSDGEECGWTAEDDGRTVFKPDPSTKSPPQRSPAALDRSIAEDVADAEEEVDAEEVGDEDMIVQAFRELHNRDPSSAEVKEFVEMLEADGDDDEDGSDDEEAAAGAAGEEEEDEVESPSEEDMSQEEQAQQMLREAAMNGHKGAQRELRKLMQQQAGKDAEEEEEEDEQDGDEDAMAESYAMFTRLKGEGLIDEDDGDEYDDGSDYEIDSEGEEVGWTAEDDGRTVFKPDPSTQAPPQRSTEEEEEEEDEEEEAPRPQRKKARSKPTAVTRTKTGKSPAVKRKRKRPRVLVEETD